jgi:hypothetical protein
MGDMNPNKEQDVRRLSPTVANLQFQAAEAYTMALAANRPRVDCTSQSTRYLPFARRLKAAVNNLLKQIEFEVTMQRLVLDAFFRVGIAKVCREDAGPVEVDTNVFVDPGKPFIRSVSYDNFCYDTTAGGWESCSYMAESYDALYEKLEADDRVDKEVLGRAVRKEPPAQYPDGEVRTKDTAGGEDSRPNPLDETVPCIDVWFPRLQKICTFIATSKNTPWEVAVYKPLRTIKWTGTKKGPYRNLSYGPVPEHVEPVSLSSNLSFLDKLYNNLTRKTSNQARRQKNVMPFKPGDEDDAAALQKVKDGFTVKVNDPDSVKVVSIPGADQATVALSMGVVDMFDRMAGNLPAKIGLGPQSETVGQDQMISEKVSKHEARLQQRTAAFVVSLITELASQLWDDPVTRIHDEIEEDAEHNIRLENSWEPGVREGNFSDYDLSIEPFSMAYKSPQEHAATINQLITQKYIPGIQSGLITGITLDGQAMVELDAELLNEPRLKQVLRTGPTIDPQQDTPRQAANTTRTNIRKSVPTGGTEQSRRGILQQALLSGSQNPDQAASLTRQRA